MNGLTRALLAAVLFLENSGSTDVDPDAAVRALEDIAAALLPVAGSHEELEFRDALARLARQLPLMIGWN